MKKLLLAFLLVFPSLAFGDEAQVQPHLFLDLNGNGVSDLEEGMPPSSNPEVVGIDEVVLPPTPDDEPTN